LRSAARFAVPAAYGDTVHRKAAGGQKAEKDLLACITGNGSGYYHRVDNSL
jgi:hypothetical protein